MKQTFLDRFSSRAIICRVLANPMADQFIQTLQQALQRNAKSTVLKSLGWLVAILLSGTVASSHYGNDKWLVVLFAILAGISILVYIAAFVFFAIKNPDLLRSEKYSIQKMAIEHGFIGDDMSGLIKIVKIGNVPLLEDEKPGDKSKENK